VTNLEDNYTTIEHSVSVERASSRKFEDMNKNLEIHESKLETLDQSLNETLGKVETKADIEVTDGLKEDL